MPELAAHLERVARELALRIGALIDRGPVWAQDVEKVILPALEQERILRGCEVMTYLDGLRAEITTELNSIAAKSGLPCPELHESKPLGQAVAAALAACAREASEKLEPYCRHLNSCAAFPARSEQQIRRDCDCGLAALEAAANGLRGVGPTAQNATKTKCPMGHDYDWRTRRSDGRQYRACGQCQRSLRRGERAAGEKA